MATRKAVVVDGTSSPLGEITSTDALGIPRIAGTAGTPTVSASGVSLGTGGATVAGTDLSGTITVVLGVISLTVTLTVSVTFNAAYPSSPFIQVQPASAAASSAVQLGMPYVSAKTGSGSNWTGFTLSIPVGLAVTGGTLKYDYLVSC